MDVIDKITSINFVSVFTSVFVIMFCVVAIVEIIGKFSEFVGKPFKWVQKKNEDHIAIEQLTKITNEIKSQQDTDREQSIKHDKIIKEDLSKMSDAFFDKTLEDMRWRILDFASAVSSGRKFNRESYDFIIRTYDKYEKLLEERNQTNGLIDETMIFIRKKYQEQLREGITD